MSRRGKKTNVPSFDLFVPTSELSSLIKKRVRSENTYAEIALRHHVWSLGLRYRLHVKNLPGKPDLVFPSAKVVVFCDGDFWHGRNWEKQKEQLKQRKNSAYWIPKIQSNIERDILQTKKLSRMGWLVLRVWETDILKDPISHAIRVNAVVRKRRLISGKYSDNGNQESQGVAEICRAD